MQGAGIMIAAALAVWAGVAAMGDAALRFDVTLAMAGPLIVAVVTWIWMERAYRRARARFTGHMTAAFGFTAVFFAAYVAGVLTLTSVRSVPFAVAFTASFVTLHAMEAFFLRRLLQGDAATRP
jgi:hypothetical protein